MEMEILHAAEKTAATVEGPWQFAALGLILVFVLILFYLHRSSDLKTLERTHRRDDEQARQDEKMATIEKKVDGIGHSFDRHINEEHSGIKAMLKEHYDGINSKIEELAKSVHNIELGFAAVEERHKHEDMVSMTKRKRGTQ
jgi:flagellar biosynthesis/type III secretory pathway M-ring protein FliF/YscJ